MPEFAFDKPKSVWLEALKVNDGRSVGPGRSVPEKVGEKVQTIVRRDRDFVALANGECVHDDLIREIVHVVFNRTFEIGEVV